MKLQVYLHFEGMLKYTKLARWWYPTMKRKYHPRRNSEGWAFSYSLQKRLFENKKHFIAQKKKTFPKRASNKPCLFVWLIYFTSQSIILQIIVMRNWHIKFYWWITCEAKDQHLLGHDAIFEERKWVLNCRDDKLMDMLNFHDDNALTNPIEIMSWF